MVWSTVLVCLSDSSDSSLYRVSGLPPWSSSLITDGPLQRVRLTRSAGQRGACTRNRDEQITSTSVVQRFRRAAAVLERQKWRGGGTCGAHRVSVSRRTGQGYSGHPAGHTVQRAVSAHRSTHRETRPAACYARGYLSYRSRYTLKRLAYKVV